MPNDDKVGITPAAVSAAAKGDFKNAVVAMTPGGIRAQEEAGQRTLAESMMFPREMNGLGRCPADECVKGAVVISRDPWETQDCVVCNGTGAPPDAYEYLEKLGFEFGEQIDELFIEAKLPEGWEKRPTEHHMHTHIVDGQGRKRGNIFYKAAFYDRSADFRLVAYHSTDVVDEDGVSWYGVDRSGEYSIRGRALNADGDVLFETEPADVVVDMEDFSHMGVKDDIQQEVTAWLDEHRPDWRDARAYWLEE